MDSHGTDQLAFFGDIASAVAGFSLCLLIFVAATAALLRALRQAVGHGNYSVELALHVPSDFDSVMDEKAGVRLAMKEYIESNDERWD